MSVFSKELIKASIITFLALALLWNYSSKLTYQAHSFNQKWDHHKYIYIANSPIAQFHIAPFCWRILNPTLAKLLPFELHINFQLLTFISLWATSILMYLILINQGFSHALASCGALFFISLNWATRFNIFDFWLTDPLAFVLTTLSILLIQKEKFTYAAITLALGVLTKESVIFAAPLIYTLNTTKFFDARLLAKTILLTLPAIFILVLLRIYVPALNGVPEYINTLPLELRDANPYNFKWLFNNIGIYRIKSLELYDIYYLIVGVFSLSICFLCLFAPKENLRLLFKFSPFIALHYLSILFAVNTERLIVGAFPAIIIMAMHGSRNIANRFHINPWMFCLPSVVSIIYLSLNPRVWFIEMNIQFAITAAIICYIGTSRIWAGYRKKLLP